MVKDIKKIMEELAGDSDRIIVNPNDLEQLKKQGFPIEVTPSPTLDELLEKRKERAILRSKELPSLPEGLPPAIQALYQEIRECIFFGLYRAAITMSSILKEFITM